MGTRVHAFIDGGYLKRVGEKFGVAWPCPSNIAQLLTYNGVVHHWDRVSESLLGRVTYYDGLMVDDAVDSEEQKRRLEQRKKYWDYIEVQHVTHLGFGYARRGRDRDAMKLRQKAVDTLLAVDMLVGAFDRTYDLALLVAGDADFVPVVEEVRRRGRWVVVGAEEETLSADLRRAADRVQEIKKAPANPMQHFNHIHLTGVPGL